MIRLYTRNLTLLKMVRVAFTGEPVGAISHEMPRWLDRPRAARYVITRAMLNRSTEYFAASLGAIPIVLPEGMPWLIQQAKQCNEAGETLILVGSDYIRPPLNGE